MAYSWELGSLLVLRIEYYWDTTACPHQCEVSSTNSMFSESRLVMAEVVLAHSSDLDDEIKGEAYSEL